MPRKTSGQMIVILAVALVVLVGFTGLAVDLGRYLVAMGRLRQAADAGALAAAAQFRENRGLDEMTAAARSVIQANGFTPTQLEVNTCDTKPGDTYLCNPPRRKKVEVTVAAQMPTTFLRIVGWQQMTLSTIAVGEAASMDVVLVIDTSESMTYDAPPGDPMRDPSQCNPAHNCHPFEEVRNAATNFTYRVLNLSPDKEQDRLAVVVFSDGWRQGDTAPLFPPGTPPNPTLDYAWTYNRNSALGMISSMQVFDPGGDPCTDDELAGRGDRIGPCRRYDSNGTYLGLDCPLWRNPNYGHDPSTCTTTDIGGGLFWAGKLLSTSGREDALWVVVLLTDGAANATLPKPYPDNDLTDDNTLRSTLPLGYCPTDTFDLPPFCRDVDPDSRHVQGDSEYDADDYARDMADYVACSNHPAAGCHLAGQSAAIFTIGLGNQVLRTSGNPHKPDGGALLRYIAAVGDDGDPATDPCAGETDYTQWCGNYYFSPSGAQLDQVFADIASRLFTRLTH